jgi:hypothetical protein
MRCSLRSEAGHLRTPPHRLSEAFFSCGLHTNSRAAILTCLSELDHFFDGAARDGAWWFDRFAGHRPLIGYGPVYCESSSRFTYENVPGCLFNAEGSSGARDLLGKQIARGLSAGLGARPWDGDGQCRQLPFALTI